MKVKAKLISVNFSNQNYTIRHETLQEQSYIVVPVTMMVEGVHSGSGGPMLHEISELGRYPGSWDGIAVVINHPQEGEVFVSANSPEVTEQERIGTIFNTHVSGNALKAEAWLQVAKVSEDLLSSLEAGNIIEVSVGVFTDMNETPGQWNGDNYIGTAINHRPDHLALLPNSTGACSVDDGCGIRTNKKGEINVEVNEILKGLKTLTKSGVTPEQLMEAYTSAKPLGLSVADLVNNVGEGFVEIAHLAQRKLDSMDDGVRVHWLEELFES